MPIATYFTFEDQAQDAITFYEEAFEVTVKNLVTYKSLGMPDLDEKSQNLVMNAVLEVEGHSFMFSDTPSFMSKVPYGRNVGIVIELTDASKLTTYFEKLSQDAADIMTLQKTEWSDLFGQITDKFGIAWSFNLIG